MFEDKKDFNSLKLADFGFSTYSENDKDDRDCGTLIYKSPEQILQPFYDHYIDYWATGFILFILCSGGSHPIYREKMTSEEYTHAFKNNIEWNFPPDFPKYTKTKHF